MAVFDQLTETDAEGVTVHQSDVLRAAVVFLHASLEDLLRSTLAHTLPYADRSVLSDLNLRLHDDVRGTKFLVADLVELRGLAVDEVIENAIERFLETTNFSHIDAVDWALKASGLHANEILGAHRAGLAALISRRHLIAHRADRHPSPQATGAAPISKQQVEAWQRSVQSVGRAIIGHQEGE